MPRCPVERRPDGLGQGALQLPSCDGGPARAGAARNLAGLDPAEAVCIPFLDGGLWPQPSSPLLWTRRSQTRSGRRSAAVRGLRAPSSGIVSKIQTPRRWLYGGWVVSEHDGAEDVGGEALLALHLEHASESLGVHAAADNDPRLADLDLDRPTLDLA